MKTGIILAAALAPAAAANPDPVWYAAGVAPDERGSLIAFIDKASIQTREDGWTGVWLWRVDETPDEFGADNVKIHYWLDCKTSQVEIREIVAFSERKRIRSSIDNAGPQAIDPGSIGDFVSHYLCGGEPLRARIPDPYAFGKRYLKEHPISPTR